MFAAVLMLSMSAAASPLVVLSLVASDPTIGCANQLPCNKDPSYSDEELEGLKRALAQDIELASSQAQLEALCSGSRVAPDKPMYFPDRWRTPSTIYACSAGNCRWSDMLMQGERACPLSDGRAVICDSASCWLQLIEATPYGERNSVAEARWLAGDLGRVILEVRHDYYNPASDGLSVLVYKDDPTRMVHYDILTLRLLPKDSAAGMAKVAAATAPVVQEEPGGDDGLGLGLGVAGVTLAAVALGALVYVYVVPSREVTVDVPLPAVRP